MEALFGVSIPGGAIFTAAVATEAWLAKPLWSRVQKPAEPASPVSLESRAEQFLRLLAEDTVTGLDWTYEREPGHAARLPVIRATGTGCRCVVRGGLAVGGSVRRVPMSVPALFDDLQAEQQLQLCRQILILARSSKDPQIFNNFDFWVSDDGPEWSLGLIKLKALEVARRVAGQVS